MIRAESQFSMALPATPPQPDWADCAMASRLSSASGAGQTPPPVR